MRGFHARGYQKVLVRAVVERDLFRSALLLLSSFFILLSSFFFSHPESCLKLKIFVRKSDVLGGARGMEPGERKMKKCKRKKTKKFRKSKTETFFDEEV